MSFPQIVGKLIEAGVEYYHLDYVGRCKRFYDSDGTCVVTPIAFEQLPSVAAELDVDALRNNIQTASRRASITASSPSGRSGRVCKAMSRFCAAARDLFRSNGRSAHRMVPRGRAEEAVIEGHSAAR